MADIHYVQAANDYQNNRKGQIKQNEEERLAALEEIKTSNFSMFDASDVNYLAAQAGITPNEARRLNQKHSGFDCDMLGTFIDDETDSIWDYYS